MRGTDPRSSGCWVGADLWGANFQGARPGGVEFQGANLAGANLSGADLSGVNLREANLHGTDPTDAIVEHVEWEGVNCALDASI